MRVVLVFILLGMISGCKNQQEPINYTLLEKHSGKNPASFGDNGYIYIYAETYLVDNLIEREQEKEIDQKVYDILFDYFKNNNKICQLEDDITYCSMSFYRRSSCTEHFIENPEDATGMFQSYLDDCKGDSEYSFFYTRDKDNPNMWTNSNVALYWDKKYRDTIYCSPNRKKVKLPDMPR